MANGAPCLPVVFSYHVLSSPAITMMGQVGNDGRSKDSRLLTFALDSPLSRLVAL